MKETISKTTFVNPELERLQTEIALLKEQKKSIDLMNKEKLNQDSKKEVVVVNGDKYVVNGSKMDKVVSPSIPKKKEDVCLTFCKYGSCSNPTCRNRHDPSLVRICPAFLRVWIHVTSKDRVVVRMSSVLSAMSLIPNCYHFVLSI